MLMLGSGLSFFVFTYRSGIYFRSDTLPSMSQTHRILQFLADGRFHSGADLGRRLGISRGAVWKHVRQIENLGLEVHAVRGRGYRLPHGLELLENQKVTAAMTPEARDRLAGLEVHTEVDSTNRYLRTAACPGPGRGRACLAERQTQGRGRRGRPWVSPFAANLYASVTWRFPSSPAALSGLSLAVGVAAAQALAEAGAEQVGLKWPNDLHWQGRKLGGVLLELFGEAAGPCDVIVGVGINVAMPEASAALVDQPWTDLRTVLGSRCPGRNRLAGLLLSELLAALARYERHGLEAFLEDWRRRDIAAGREVELQLPQSRIAGTALGVDETGALLVCSGGSTLRFASGEISMRMPS